MRVLCLLLSILFLCNFVSLYAYSQNFDQDDIIDSMELCPFMIEVYPETLHVGDLLHIKMSFENKSDMITWALPRQICDKDVMDTHIVNFIFQDAKTGIQYPWKGQGTNEQWFVRDVWQPIKPGEKGRTQFWTLGFPPILSHPDSASNI